MDIQHGTSIIICTDINETYITADSKLISGKGKSNLTVNKIVEHNGYYYAKAGVYDAEAKDPKHSFLPDVTIKKYLDNSKPFLEVVENLAAGFNYELVRFIQYGLDNNDFNRDSFIFQLKYLSQIVIVTNIKGEKKIALLSFYIQDDKVLNQVIDLSDRNDIVFAIGHNEVVDRECKDGKYFKDRKFVDRLNTLMRIQIEEEPAEVGFPIRTLLVKKDSVKWFPDVIK